ncbi:hypothetical protein P167DRAFT_531278 [Morchella conica CCBAS932]|uniref:Actin binding protein n=1 Tax=Morchella conica CCBAS932 TaxID=1392247 RepID=A0A3N4L4E6_9PEZI|nr:hypothetical protein P167DRAFT_531278 [Morchella conica CCBAS932]
MASLDISPEIGRSYKTLVSSPAPANKSPTHAQWAVFAVSVPLQNAFVASSTSKASTLKVHSTGEGELEELIEEFNDGKVQFAFVKVKDPNSGLPKFVLIAWCGEGVPERVKGYFTGHLNAAAKVLHGYHVQVTARSESDLSPESIVQKVGDASGAKYSSASTSTAPPTSAPKPPAPSSKPAYTPTRVSGATGSRAPYKREEQTDSDGWGADAPPVTRSQLEKVAPAYKPTKVDISAIRAQPTSTTSGYGGASSASDRPDIVKGAYQPIGKVDIAAIRAQAQQKSERPEIVKGAYEPVGKVDIAAIRAQARPSPAHEEDEERPRPVSERSAAFSQSERLTSLPKPKPVKKFGTGAPSFGTKPPTPGGFGLNPSVPAAAPVGAASRDFGSSGGKTPAQLWAEKKARERGLSGASETTPPTYAGQQYPPVSTSNTGRSSGSNDGLSNKLAQQKLDDHEEDVQAPAGGISALRNKFSGAPPMGAPTSPKSPPRTGGYQFQQTTGDRAPPPPPVDISSRPTIVAGGAVALPGFPPKPADDDETNAAGIPHPPPQPPRSPTPPTPEIPGSPIRIAMPVSRRQEDPITRHEPEPESSIPIESLSRVVPQEDDLEDEEPARVRSETVGVGAGGETVEGSVGRRALILFDYEATEPNEINLVEGQIVGEVDMVDEDWWAGRNVQGESGLFPSNYVELIEGDEEQGPPPSRPEDRPSVESPPPQEEEHQATNNPSAIAQYDYAATEDNELTFPDEAIIEDIEFPDDDWWLGTYGGKRGLFPANYVELRK